LVFVGIWFGGLQRLPDLQSLVIRDPKVAANRIGRRPHRGGLE